MPNKKICLLCGKPNPDEFINHTTHFLSDKSKEVYWFHRSCLDFALEPFEKPISKKIDKLLKKMEAKGEYNDKPIEPLRNQLHTFYKKWLKIILLRKQGCSIRQIAKTTNVNRNKVFRILKRVSQLSQKSWL